MALRVDSNQEVLLIEDDPVLGSGLKTGLESGGLRVRLVTSLADAAEVLDETDVSVILLDLGLPDGDGLAFLRRQRRQNNRAPIMVITAKSHRETRIQCFDDGADDYITKPYDLDEVIARLRALLRRVQGLASDFVHFDDYELDLKGQVVRQGNRTIRLTLREFRVLQFLALRAGRWASKADIEMFIYDDSTEVESNTIESTIYALRKKLSGESIITARGLGYMIRK